MASCNYLLCSSRLRRIVPLALHDTVPKLNLKVKIKVMLLLNEVKQHYKARCIKKVSK